MTPEVLRELLTYEPATGKLFWRERDRKWFKSGYRTAKGNANSWNEKFVGEEAFTATNDQGYRIGSIFDRCYRAHRVIWAIQTGEWPEKTIDHKNNNRADNRFENLREATSSENNQNMSSVGFSRFLGVDWARRNGKWRARVESGGKRKHLGYFTCEREAALVYNRAAQESHGEFANLNKPYLEVMDEL